MHVRIEFEADIRKPEALSLAMYGLTCVNRGGSRRKIMPHKVTLLVDGKRQKWFDDQEAESAKRRARQKAEWAKRHAEWLKRNQDARLLHRG